MKFHFLLQIGTPPAMTPGSADQTERILAALASMEDRLMSKLAGITAAVAAMTSVQDSFITYNDALKADVAALRAELADQGVDLATIDALTTTITAGAQRMAAAMVVNTPAADASASEAPQVDPLVEPPAEAPAADASTGVGGDATTVTDPPADPAA